MRKFLFVLLLLIATINAFAQSNQVTVVGKVVEKDTNEPIIQATVQLLSPKDSSMINGNVTDANGNFAVHAKPGKYILKVSYVGYLSQFKQYTFSKNRPQVSAGTIPLSADAIMLKEAIVTAEAPMVSVSKDTMMYSSSAYRTPQGAMLEELVKKLPGAEVSDDGTVKINGKEVKKIMVDGKEFFGGDVSTGLKNLPVDMVDRVKAYDKKSDLARITGIDDGEEETVLDLTVKKGMNQGFFGNADLSVGTKDRYSGRMMMNYFKDRTQFSVIGSANNTNDQGFSGGGPRWFSPNGLNARKMLGANFATETEKLDMGGSIRYNYSDQDLIGRGYSERFLQAGSSYANTNSLYRAKTNSINFDYRLEWKPDSMTNIIFRPNFSYRSSKTNSESQSATFDSDPFDIIANPNDYLNLDDLDSNEPLKSIRVNSSNNRSHQKSGSTSVNATLQVNRKLNNKGRNITFRGRFGYTDTENDSYTDALTRYYQFDYNPDSTNIRRRYINTPVNNYTYSGRLTYSEPIAKGLFLQFSYELSYRHNTSVRSTYDLDNFGWRLDDRLPENYKDGFDPSLSKDATYDYVNHDIQAGFRLIRKKYQLDAGISVQPQNTKLSYTRGTYSTDTVRNVFNFAPNMRFRYKFSNLSQLEVMYRGRSSQPGMENLLPITNDSNPLNITMGNPGLKPSFTHTMRVFYNTYNPEKQRGIITHLMFNATQNAISNSTMYNESTGGRITQPTNINGNWNAFGMFGFNSALKNKKFNINSFSRANYMNNVAYLYNNATKTDDRNKTTNLTLAENLNGTYRNNWFEFSLNGALEYNWERSALRPQNNQEPYTYSYGASTNISLPWDMTISTNLTNQCRRGYSDSSMNRNELIWNTQIAQSFFKGAATLSFEMYDILHNQSTISRTLTAELRNVNEYNSINSYCMVHFIYKFSLFGSKEARNRFERMGPGGLGGRRGPGGGRPNGPPLGGFGGRRTF
ncbi:TonB-dependent receptor [Phocaeicola oris]|uniref:TonB-dependent receptor n=1 Tax=Phocaeicola oris TaxID=2896850 RepID=UPI00234E3ACE|nr:TonB-dependent receptor [Phocaeicola oris]MCE2616790.1 outer membrane beta-barrel protein [Phocaeicola oris]